MAGPTGPFPTAYVTVIIDKRLIATMDGHRIVWPLLSLSYATCACQILTIVHHIVFCDHVGLPGILDCPSIIDYCLLLMLINVCFLKLILIFSTANHGILQTFDEFLSTCRPYKTLHAPLGVSWDQFCSISGELLTP